MSGCYYLAVDAGTSRTAAAVAEFAEDGALSVRALPLGRHTDSAPSSIFVSPSDLLFGDAAERRGITQPERLVRQVKRRIGDDVPLAVGDRRFPPEELFALLIEWVVETAAEREGGMPAGVSIPVPVAWGPYRIELVATALAQHGLEGIRLIPEPLAAAQQYEAVEPLAAGGVLAVYDLGGGTFDAVVLRKHFDDDIEIVGKPAGLDDVGGIDVDDAVLRHALDHIGADRTALAADPDLRVALAALRRECRDAKEALSFDSEAVVPVLGLGGAAMVRLTRDELESMIDPALERTADVLADALDAAGVRVRDVDAILLTGGSSRIPRVAQVLSDRFGRPIAVDADPKSTVALGAARELALVSSDGSVAQPRTPDDDDPAHRAAPAGPRRHGRPGRRRRGALVAGVTTGAVALVGVAALSAGAAMGLVPLPFVPGGGGAVPETGQSAVGPVREDAIVPEYFVVLSDAGTGSVPDADPASAPDPSATPAEPA